MLFFFFALVYCLSPTAVTADADNLFLLLFFLSLFLIAT